MKGPGLLWFSQLDNKAFLFIDKQRYHLLDILMAYISWPWLWTPLYIVLLLICIREFGKQSIPILLFILMLIGLILFINNDLIKTSVKRLAPICDPNLFKTAHLIKPMDGCHYAFASTQAASAFAIAFFLSALLHSRYLPFKAFLFIWALIVSYSRVYNGLHFPGDIVGSFILSGILAFIVYRLYYLFFTLYLAGPEDL